MFDEINKFFVMVKDEEFIFVIPNERCRKATAIAITEMSKHNKNFVNLLNHTFRVAGASMYIAQKEKLTAASKEICFLSAIFHDVFKEEENHDVKGRDFAIKILKSLKYRQNVIEKVAESIADHSNSEKFLHTVEAKILWDADKLDKLGATAFLRRINERNLKIRLEKDKNIFLYLDSSKEIYRKRTEHTNECLDTEEKMIKKDKILK
ncbi:MAG: HD domain-containing protein [Candidatus Altiarchaeum hamiconexum]|uniref:HD domain-containing protein n=2 Tax=Candidatus Altarchaeum hamiconexum TaxID=1803513 RepID=A0A8J8CH54_9ARCH|nr:HD domain-containing protein [Candidatus Altarchaeum hamiconexum]OIQ06097.1 MAG: hypothetical protein AUK59_01135 [Candidatus Altarchaeum sp. CG2_30_32_3053]